MPHLAAGRARPIPAWAVAQGERPLRHHDRWADT